MKKSKIIGLSLGLTTLAATAVATPFVISSCSKTDSDLLNVELTKDVFSIPTDENGQSIQTGDIICGENTATIYIRNSEKLTFSLNDSRINLMIDGYSQTSIEWKQVTDNVNYSFIKDTASNQFKFETVKELSSFKNDLLQVNLEGTVEFTKDPVDGQQQSQNPEKITKKLNIKLNIRRGYFDGQKGEYVAPKKSK